MSSRRVCGICLERDNEEIGQNGQGVVERCISDDPAQH